MTLSDPGQWNNRIIRRPGRPMIDWCELGTLGVPEVSVGVLRDGSWVVDTADGLADLRDSRALVFLFPILHSSSSEIRKRLSELQRKAMDVHCAEFPFTRLVIQAVIGGGYWAEQAFYWLPEIDFEDDERQEVLEALRSIETDRTYGQKLRHESRKQRLALQRDRFEPR